LNPMNHHNRRADVVFLVRELERELPPFRPRLFHASAPAGLPPWYLFSCLRVYSFRPSRGRVARVRVRNVDLDRLPACIFLLERWRFQLTGTLPKDTGPRTIEEWEGRKRSRRPH